MALRRAYTGGTGLRGDGVHLGSGRIQTCLHRFPQRPAYTSAPIAVADDRPSGPTAPPAKARPTDAPPAGGAASAAPYNAGVMARRRYRGSTGTPSLRPPPPAPRYGCAIPPRAAAPAPPGRSCAATATACSPPPHPADLARRCTGPARGRAMRPAGFRARLSPEADVSADPAPCAWCRRSSAVPVDFGWRSSCSSRSSIRFCMASLMRSN